MDGDSAAGREVPGRARLGLRGGGGGDGEHERDAGGGHRILLLGVRAAHAFLGELAKKCRRRGREHAADGEGRAARLGSERIDDVGASAGLGELPGAAVAAKIAPVAIAELDVRRRGLGDVEPHAHDAAIPRSPAASSCATTAPPRRCSRMTERRTLETKRGSPA